MLKLLIHGANVHGRGALKVASGVVEAVTRNRVSTVHSYEVDVVGSEALVDTMEKDFKGSAVLRTIVSKERKTELFVNCNKTYQNYNVIMRLADLPLRSDCARQIVLLQNQLLTTKKLPFVLKFHPLMQIKRWVFRRNIPFVHHWVVQTEHMVQDLLKLGVSKSKISKLFTPSEIMVFAQNLHTCTVPNSSNSLIHFYPADGYYHKQKFLLAVHFWLIYRRQQKKLLLTGFRPKFFPHFRGIEWLGNLDSHEMCALYQKIDVVVFPSLIESLGLPIFEASSFGKKVRILKADYAESATNLGALVEVYGDVSNMLRGTNVLHSSNIRIFGKKTCFEKGLIKIIQNKL